MFSRNDGSFSNRTTNAASSSSSLRSTSRGVTSSGRIAKAGALERGESVAEFHPADVIAEPGMVRRRKRPRRIEAAGRDVDEIGRVDVFVCQRRTAGAAKTAVHLRRGFKDDWRAPRVAELALRECHPRDDGSRGHAPAGLAVTNHAVRGFRRRGIANRAAHAAALNVVQFLLHQNPEVYRVGYGRSIAPLTVGDASSPLSFVGRSPWKHVKKPRRKAGLGSRGNGGLVPQLGREDR